MSIVTIRLNFTFCLLLFFLFSNNTSYSQDRSIDLSVELVFSDDSKTDITPVPVVAPLKNSNVDFILWFMGTKEDVNTKISNESFSKKSFLTSGREPNHLLLKTLLKKAMNTKTC